jgi:hypothetical protein
METTALFYRNNGIVLAKQPHCFEITMVLFGDESLI